jgi:uncharacterized protein (DUF58 family)
MGRLVIGGTIAAAIFGIDPRQTLAFHFASVLVALLAVAVAASIRWKPHLELSRLIPDTITVDLETSYSVTITNHGDRPEVDLVLADFLLTQYPNVEDFQHAVHQRKEIRLNWFDRRVGFPRWLNLVRKSRGARLKCVAIPSIPPHSSVTVVIPLTALRRGKLVFTNLEVRRPDPLGLYFAKHRIKQYGELVALPKRYKVPPFTWNSERHFHRGGLALAAVVGDSEEFIGLREYRPGDPLRHMHWRSFAKRGTPVMKEHQDEFFDRHALVVDTFLGDSSPNDFEAAISIAASFIQAERPTDSILDLVFIEQRVWRLTTGRGLSNSRQILLQLAELQPARTDNFAHLATYLSGYLERLASIIFVGVSWDTSRQNFIDELHLQRMRCLVLRAGDPTTNEPKSHAQDVNTPRFVRPMFIEKDIESITLSVRQSAS